MDRIHEIEVVLNQQGIPYTQPFPGVLVIKKFGGI